MPEKLGIIGGMGSQAAAHFFSRIVHLTPATHDQEHIEIILHNNNHVSDRTAAILGRGPSPLPELFRSVDLLDGLGVKYIAIPCMTTHFFLPQLQKRTSAIILNAIDETCRYIDRKFPFFERIGILATEGTIRARLFQKRIEALKRNALVPSELDLEQLVMKGIYMDRGIKAGYTVGPPRSMLLKAAKNLIEKGAEALILGCTEIPLVLQEADMDVPMVDAMEVLASIAVKKCI